MTADELLARGVLTISMKEAASILGVNTRLVSKQCVDGEIPSLVIGRRRLVLFRPLMKMLTGEEVHLNG